MITEQHRRALSAIRINSAANQDDVWAPSPFHVEGLHPRAEAEVLKGIRDADVSSLGIVIQGRKGAGKTHLLGWVRAQVQLRSGYFFRAELKHGLDFWESVSLAIRDDLNRVGDGGESQLGAFLRRLCAGLDIADPQDLKALAAALLTVDRQVAVRCQDTLKALVHLASADADATRVADEYLSAYADFEPADWAAWGLRPKAKSLQVIIEEISWLLALTGPTVIAVDQVDQLLELSQRKVGKAATDERCAQIGGGLMDLRGTTRRTLCVVACLPTSWDSIRELSADTVEDRFRNVQTLNRISDALVAETLVAKRLGLIYEPQNFPPPHATWPISPRAFASAPDCTPRQLLQRIESHADHCVRRGEVHELERLDVDIDEEPIEVESAEPDFADLSAFDARFEELRRQAEVGPALDPATEDEYMPRWLSAGLNAWIIERGRDRAWRQGPTPSVRPALHAQLVRTLNEETDDEAYWAFRAVAHPQPNAAQKRLRDAFQAADLVDGVPTRTLIILRNTPWSNGPVTRKLVTRFREAGGRDLPVTNPDLRTFRALRELLDKNEVGLEQWLISRQPASNTELFGEVLPADDPGWPPEDADVRAAEEDPAAIVFGEQVDGSVVEVKLEALRRHVAIFAGAGSGKTVFIRRLVEECALRGVSAIVLDPNNDLARLGDAWPAAPPGWGSDDEARAARYLTGTEVVIWTPGVTGGRPLAFRALPEFASVRDDIDEFLAAVEVAVDTLAPRANVNGTTNKAMRSRAVLREVIEHYGRQGGQSLTGLVELLTDLPAGVSRMRNADKLAGDLADALNAARINDPLFGDGGEPVDPEILLTPSAGKRARVSVISFVGLRSEERRQGFVSQLQMELFAWIKKNPAGEQPLGALFVMDEAQTIAPAGALTPSTRSSIALAQQARKYGLGLVFATQAPKGLHNQIPGNATTQLIGRLIVPAQIAAAEEIARAAGGDLSGIGKLGPGQFQIAGDGFGFRLVRTRQCLSHHPKSPPTPEEVVERARRGL